LGCSFGGVLRFAGSPDCSRLRHKVKAGRDLVANIPNVGKSRGRMNSDGLRLGSAGELQDSGVHRRPGRGAGGMVGWRETGLCRVP
jgi:hypothetical protein